MGCESRRSLLLVAPQYPPVVGGYERQAEALARWLVARGWQVTVVTDRLHRYWPARETVDGVETHRLPATRRRRAQTLLLVPVSIPFLVRYLDCCDAVQVYASGWHVPLTVVLARLRRVPVVARPTGSGFLPSGLAGRGVRWALRHADRVVAVSRALADEAVGLGVSPERIVFIPNGVDTALYHAVAASQRAELRGRLGLPDGPLALFVGRLHPVKLLSVLLYAWERVAERCGDAHLLLVGDGPQRAELEQQVATAGLGDRVTFLGAVADPVLYYQTANVFVLPSASEGLSNAMLEAMACGLPVVVTAVSGAADVVRDGKNGKLVPPNKPNALAEILIELIEDVEQRLELGDQARRTVARHYSMEAMGARYEQLYLALLSLAEP